MKISRWLAAGMLVLSAVSCRQTGRSEAAAQGEEPSAAGKEFTLPEIPSFLQDGAAQEDYLALHFWDRYDFSDTSLVRSEATAAAVMEYVRLLGRQTAEQRETVLSGWLAKAEAEPVVLSALIRMMHLYCMDPNSPIRNDEVYEPVCRYVIDHAPADEAGKYQAEHELKMIRMNRRGEKANDFTAFDAGGRAVRMHQIESPYLILLFYNPDCSGCEQRMSYIKASRLWEVPGIWDQVKILSVFADSSELNWQRAQETVPDTWMNVWDRKGLLMTDEVYDLKALPTLYLLDAGKSILLKDCEFEEIETFLASRLLR